MKLMINTIWTGTKGHLKLLSLVVYQHCKLSSINNQNIGSKLSVIKMLSFVAISFVV